MHAKYLNAIFSDQFFGRYVFNTFKKSADCVGNMLFAFLPGQI